MDVTTTLVLDGTISANGSSGSSNYRSGGSGGSIYVKTRKLEGHGKLEVSTSEGLHCQHGVVRSVGVLSVQPFIVSLGRLIFRATVSGSALRAIAGRLSDRIIVLPNAGGAINIL